MTALSRRRLLAAGAGLAVLAGCRAGPREPVEPTLRDPAEPVPPLAERIGALEGRHNAYVGLYGANLDSGTTVSNRENDRFALCSTFKTYAAARVLQMSAAGALRLDDTMFVDPAGLQPHSPATAPHAGGVLPLSELCRAALQQSDNTAANLLLRVIGGPQAITAFARSIGDGATRLDRWEVELNSAIPGDPRDTSTPGALGGGYRNLLVGNALPQSQRAQLEAWMRGNTTSAMSMRAGLPKDWTTADKTGAGDYGSTNAIGIAFGPDGRRLLLSIMTRSQGDDPNTANLQSLIAEVTALVLPYLVQP